MTKQLISQISESFPNTSSLYQYLDTSIAFQMNDKQMYTFKSNESARIRKCNVNSDILINKN